MNFFFLSSTVLPPPRLSASSPSNDSIVVSWAPVAHAVLYTLSTHQFGSNTSTKHNTSSTNLTLSGLDAGSLYVIEGFAWDPEGRQGEGGLHVNQTTSKEAPRHFSVCCCSTGETHASSRSPLFNSVYFIKPNIRNYEFASEGFTVRTHMTSLTFDLTLDQDKLPRNRKKTFTGKNKGKKPSGEQQRRIPLLDGQKQYMSCDQKESLQSYIDTFNDYGP